MKKILQLCILLIIASIGIYLYQIVASYDDYQYYFHERPSRNNSIPLSETAHSPWPSGSFQLLPDDFINTTRVSTNSFTDTGYLALLNREHAITESARNLVSAWPTVAVSTTDIQVHPSALDAVAALFSSAREEGVGPFFISSGYRGIMLQYNLYNAPGANRDYIMAPGHSEHHTGLAVDILATGVLKSQLATSREGRWLAANAWRYGLILRYPQGRTDITGVAFEPWHFRYVGQLHAWLMHEYDLVLEEYLALIADNGGFQVHFNGYLYRVLYVPPIYGILYLPDTHIVTISNNNMGSYIITLREAV